MICGILLSRYMSQESVNQKEADVSSLATDTLYSILSHERRRYALYCLQEYRNPLALADLAEEVALLEYDTPRITEIDAEGVKSVYMSLYHTHLPKMAAANVLEYDQETDSVQLTSELPAIELE